MRADACTWAHNEVIQRLTDSVLRRHSLYAQYFELMKFSFSYNIGRNHCIASQVLALNVNLMNRQYQELKGYIEPEPS